LIFNRENKAADFSACARSQCGEEEKVVHTNENGGPCRLDSEAIARGKEQAEWLFVDDKGSVLNERYLRKVFARILRKAELPHFNPYDLRHTYASLLLSEGVPLVYVSQ
jgi:hypothetical protein